jgi:hypothetical protein
MSQHNTVNLGELVQGVKERDAIHIAVLPVEAGEDLQICESVALVDNKAFKSVNDAIGIVDPFLPQIVNKGQCFWLLLFPNTITGLRHEWCHPQIPKHTVTEKQAAEKWLREFCLHTGNNYDLLMNQIKNRSEYINVVDDDAQSYYFEHYQDFWKNYTIVTEIYLDENNRPYIRCVC